MSSPVPFQEEIRPTFFPPPTQAGTGRIQVLRLLLPRPNAVRGMIPGDGNVFVRRVTFGSVRATNGERSRPFLFLAVTDRLAARKATGDPQRVGAWREAARSNHAHLREVP